MAKVKGVKEKLHSPIYDAFFVKADPVKTFTNFMTDPRMIRFFVDVQDKTRLETNLQASGVLPSLNSFEARALRVVASAFCVPREALKFSALRNAVVDAANRYGRLRTQPSPTDQEKDMLVTDIRKVVEAVTASALITTHIRSAIVDAGNTYALNVSQIKVSGTALGLPLPDPLLPVGTTPPPELTEEQDRLITEILDAFEAGCAAASTLLPELIYNSVTTLLVGEKIMIEMPTFYFPSGAGVSPGNGGTNNHGEPDPMATFRFAEPVIIEPQQNFRVEMLFPQGVPKLLEAVSGPLRIWVVLDGYMTRDVQ